MAFFHALLEFFTITDYAGFNHFSKQVVTFTCTFPYSCKHGKTIVLLGNVVDEFHDENGLTYSSTTEQTDFTPFGIRFQQVDDFDSGKQDFL